jgi:hypothetical protein
LHTDQCYKCVTKRDHPSHDNGTENLDYDHSAHTIDWYEDARKAMKARRDGIRDKG